MKRKPPIALFTPPLLQLNTPYPATAVLKGYLQNAGYEVYHADLGIELIHCIFSKQGLTSVFSEANLSKCDEHTSKIYKFRHSYIQCIDPVIRFLENPETAAATRIINRNWLPEGKSFESLEDTEFDYGPLGITDFAKHLSTLFLTDLANFIRKTIDPGFEFIRYASKISTHLPSFDPALKILDQTPNLIQRELIRIFENHIQKAKPEVVGFTIPFPGNLMGGLWCAKHLKANHPKIVSIMGGGYPTTELRQLSDKRIFDFIDYIVLDEGEQSLVKILKTIENPQTDEKPSNCFQLIQDEIVFHPLVVTDTDIPPGKISPDFSGLPFDKYLSLIEFSNPMHRLWSDGRWNKLTLARGCYWANCAFCDTSLSYIRDYRPVDACVMVDQMEEIIRQTGNHSFHFTDEAAPPALLREISIEILKRKLHVIWWTNIRFEKSFTRDLCRLMSMAGCIAVSGGIETASDRLLKKMKKGVNIEQAANVCHHFTQTGIMVHAYLMYGFPGQTGRETIDALEVVRQFFELGILQSGFWHRFALTIHSPVYSNPDSFGITLNDKPLHPFANNEWKYTEKEARHHEHFDDGLRTAQYNYMKGVGFEQALNTWFRQSPPKTSHPPTLVKQFIKPVEFIKPTKHQKVLWPLYDVEYRDGKKSALIIHKPSGVIELLCPEHFGLSFFNLLKQHENEGIYCFSLEEFEKAFLTEYEGTAFMYWETPWMLNLQHTGLIIV